MNVSVVCNVLSSLTGNLWTVAPEDPTRPNVNDTINREDGMSLWFVVGGYQKRGRITIHFHRPRDREGNYVTVWGAAGEGQLGNPSITVAETKSDEAIAKDIARRLIPDCEQVFAAVKKSIADRSSFVDGRHESIVNLAKALGTKPKTVHNHPEQFTGEIDLHIAAQVPSFGKYGYGKIQVNSKDGIDIELKSMNYDVAVKVAEAIKNVLSSTK